MTAKDVADSLLLLGPGFVLLKTIYLFGGQRQRSEWEWVVWSVLASVVLANVAVPLASATLTLIPGLPVSEADLAVVYRFVLAVGLGFLIGRAWVAVRNSRRQTLVRLYRSVSDSAWDLVLDNATRKDPKGRLLFGIELTINQSGDEASYYGSLSAFGYEAAAAQQWIYITAVQRWEGVGQGYKPLANTEGMLFRSDQVQRIRIIKSAKKAASSVDP